MSYQRIKGAEVEQVITYLTADEKYKLKLHCLKQNITMSKYIKTLVLNSLNK